MAQAWGKDRDYASASKYGQAASYNDWNGYNQGAQGSYGRAYGQGSGDSCYWCDRSGRYICETGTCSTCEDDSSAASASYGSRRSGYDNDEWAKQACGSDYDSRYGESYDSVDAKSYDNTWYAKEVQADDDQWAEDYDGCRSAYGGGYGYKGSDNNSAYAAGGGAFGVSGGNKWDAWSRDQDYKEKISYDQTRAKAYKAQSYDQWHNEDNDKYGAQAWGKDRDCMGASTYGRRASASDYDRASGAGYYGAADRDDYGHGKGYGYGGYGYDKDAEYKSAGYAARDADRSASASWGSASAGYDNDEWAKQGSGSDYDSRFGKSFDSVSARSYENETFARDLQVDDDMWAEDYDDYYSKQAAGYGKAGSYCDESGCYYVRPTYESGAAKAGASGAYGRQGQGWDAYNRDQDLSVQESYDMTWAKSYDAESYDEWNNQDQDKWGCQSWGKDRDGRNQAAWGNAASDANARDYYGSQYGAAYDNDGYGKGYGYGGKGYGYDNQYAQGGAYANGMESDNSASASYGAARAGYDNDEWAKLAHSSDYDSRYGKSYDFVNAKSYDNEEYARKVRADDDQWAEDFDRRGAWGGSQWGAASSQQTYQPAQKTYSKPAYSGYYW